MYNFLSEVITSKGEPSSEKFIFDFNSLDFIKPIGITVFNNLLLWLDNKKINVKFKIPKLEKWRYNTKSPINFLDDFGFFERWLAKKLNPDSSLRKSTMPLKDVSHGKYNEWFESYFIPWLSKETNTYNNLFFEDIKVCMNEIFNNIKDHSTIDIGCVCSQHYPKNKEIELAISDFGVGIPYKVQEKEPNLNLNDAEAILKAIEEGYTVNETGRNQGLGLKHIIDIIVVNKRSLLNIYSNKGKLSFKYDEKNNDIIPNPELKAHFYPGTLFEIKLNTNEIFNKYYLENFDKFEDEEL